MGLLTNPQTREKISSIVSKYNNKLCVLCYLVGLGWFLALAYQPFNASVYFSENALLPGLVEPDFHHDHGAGQFYQRLKEEIKSIKDNSAEDRKYRLPSEWFLNEFTELGLDAYEQNFTFKYPHNILKGQEFKGRNVYGILRGPRAASTEALVLCAPYRPPESNMDRTNAGLGLMLGLAKAFRRHTYWAKDIIFLVTEHEHVGIQAWLSAYHYSINEFILPGELKGRSGSIQAAINLEISGDFINRLNLKLEGLNGQLPNLDLINTIVRLCKRESIMPVINKQSDYWNPESYEGFQHSLQTMMSMMWNQASGTPSANHGLFHRYNIEAVTLQSVKMKNSKRSSGFPEMGRVLEGVIRSLNNLLERFHQSFFFYLLPATGRYVSIGLYMPPFGIMAVPILIKIYGIKEEEEKSQEKDSGSTDTSDTAAARPEQHAEGSTKEVKSGQTFDTVLSLVPTCLMPVFLGLAALYGPPNFVEMSHSVRTEPQEGLLLGLGAIHVAAIIYPWMLHRRASKKPGPLASGPDWQLLKMLGLLLLGISLSALSVLNISLAFFLAAAWTPVVLLVRPTHSRLASWLQVPLLFAISPLGMLAVASTIHQVAVLHVTDLAALLPKVYETMQNSLLTVVMDNQMLGSWMYSFCCLLLLPNWCFFWCLLWTKYYS